jgi:serine protease inhibitor
MIKKIILIAIVFILLSGVAVAAFLFLFPYEPDQPPQADDTDSTKEGIQEVVEANNEFAFDLYSKIIKKENENVFYSPYSIFAALAMTYEGAEGRTAEEMKSVFHFPEDNILRPNFASVYNNINEENKEYELKTGNALWVQRDFPFLEEYTNRVENYYGGKAAPVDFKNETERSRETINSFIQEQTKDKIKNLIPQGVFDPSTKLVLTNAIYFKGVWYWEFDADDTYEEIFKITSEDNVKVPMMHMKPEEAKFNYAETEDLQILELPYKGEEISMLLLLPAGNLDEIESSLTLEKFNEYKSQMKEANLTSISIPKFEFDTKYFMKNTLISLGMPTAFSGSADFSGMTDKRDLFIDNVIHQAYVGVDEKGTEAAAATAVIMKETAIMPTNIFKADRPFLFAIQEKDTGNILFLGRVVNPIK